MIDQAVELIVDSFCRAHNVKNEEIASELKITIADSFSPFLLFIECLDGKSFNYGSKIANGFIIDMLHRATNTYASMIILMISGHLQDGEAIARTLAESSLAIQYLLEGDLDDNISNYIASHYVGSAWKQEKWKNSADGEHIDYYSNLINNRNSVESNSKEMVQKILQTCGVSWPSKPKAATIDAIYKVLNREIEYRTVYKAFCGQAHHDAEDILNSFLASMSGSESISQKMFDERNAFSLFMCLWAIKYFLQAFSKAGKYFKFDSVYQQSEKSIKKIEIRHHSVNEDLKNTSMPKNWVASVVKGI